MTAFELFFSFYGLILGLSVVEAIGGFGRALRGRTRIRLGRLTPLLSIFVMLDIASFWAWAWHDFASLETVTYGVLLYGLAVAAIYYLSASIIFPGDFADWPDLDDYYDRHKVWVLSGITAANLFGYVLSYARDLPDLGGIIWQGLFLVGLLLLIVVRNRRANVVLLAVMIGQYLYWGLASVLA